MRATTVETAELEHRLEGAHRLMTERNIQALLVTAYSNIQYFTGYTTHRWMQVTAPVFAIIACNRKPVLILPAVELGRAETHPWLSDIRPLRGYTEIGVDELCNTIKDLGLAGASLGCELGSLFRLGMSSGDLDILRGQLPNAKFVDASDIFWTLRLRKSSFELRYIREAVEVTDKAIAKLQTALRPGLSEREVFRTFASDLMLEGADWPGSIPVGSRSPGDLNGWDSHLRLPTDRKIKEGDVVWLDAGCIVQGYWADFMRMFCVGRAVPEWKAAYRFIYDALHTCIEQAKPGAPVKNAIMAYERKLRSSPYADMAPRLKNGRIAHGIGLDLIEPPSMSYDDPTILQPGMVLTIEPSLYMPEIGFFMLEEDVLITERGNEILSTPASAEIPEISG